MKKLGLLNSYWVLILPYMAGGQIFAIFLFKSFFDGLPEELFESARLDGAGHFCRSTGTSCCRCRSRSSPSWR